jgi:hypothetical protein
MSKDVEATQLMLVTLFDIGAKLTDIHNVLIGGDDGEEEKEDS